MLNSVPSIIVDLLKQTYSRNKTYYHTWDYHIMPCLNEYSNYLNSFKRPKKPDEEIILSLLFHDIVYNPKSKTNEYDSAMFFLEVAEKYLSEIKGYKKFTRRVLQNILATDHDLYRVKNYTKNQALVASIDLASLGHSFQEFMENTNLIRAEYDITTTAFINGRKKFFCEFINRDVIYTNDFFYNMYEAKARENIQRYIDSH